MELESKDYYKIKITTLSSVCKQLRWQKKHNCKLPNQEMCIQVAITKIKKQIEHWKSKLNKLP